jgi:hypothetical protein
MALPDEITVVFSNAGPGSGTYTLYLIEPQQYYHFLFEDEESGWITIITYVNSGSTTHLSALWSFNTDYEFSGITEGNWATTFTNISEDPPGTGTAIVTGRGPPKAINPAPVHQATRVSKGLDRLTWEIP